MNKYHARRTVLDGIAFDSQVEAARFAELRLLERAGQISDLQVHPRFVLLQADSYGPQVRYEADFSYRQDGQLISEDVKGAATKTPTWKLKFRLAQARYPEYTFRIEER